MDRGAWQATVHGLAKSQTYLSYSVHMHTFLLKYFEEEITISQSINNHNAILFQTTVTSSILCMSNTLKKKNAFSRFVDSNQNLENVHVLHLVVVFRDFK